MFVFNMDCISSAFFKLSQKEERSNLKKNQINTTSNETMAATPLRTASQLLMKTRNSSSVIARRNVTILPTLNSLNDDSLCNYNYKDPIQSQQRHKSYKTFDAHAELRSTWIAHANELLEPRRYDTSTATRNTTIFPSLSSLNKDSLCYYGSHSLAEPEPVIKREMSLETDETAPSRIGIQQHAA